MNEFRQYRRRAISEMRPYLEGEDMSKIDIMGHYPPKLGDMIARDPNNHADQWLVSAEYFSVTFGGN